MADDVTLNSGSGGATLATDEVVTGQHYQKIKIADGTADSTAMIGGDATNGLDVDVTRVSGTVTVDGSAVTQPVSAASLPLPSGASTAAKQPALGTAGTASTDVITVQGIASMTALTVDASGTAVPVTDNGGALTVDWNGTAPPIGAGLEATALRVTVATDSTGVVSVDDNGGALTVDNGGTFAVQVDAALPTGTNAIGKLAANSGVDIGDVDVTSISAGSNTIGNVGLIGRTSGGMTIFRSIDIDETEEAVKATGGQVFSISAFNTTAVPLYLKFYNATVATVVVGTTTPVLTFVVPGNADSDGAGFIWNNEIGFAFGTAITVACTTGVADNDTGAPGANACIVNVGYA